jgi:translation initiation factor 3 subunit A
MSYGYRNYGGPQVSQKPENVLSRAQDLVSGATSKNGEKEKCEALRQIHDFISQAKNKRNWNKCYEPMMKFHLSLCVDLKDARHAKDGLHQYRSMVMQSDPMLLDVIITYLMELSESKAGAAKSKADKTASAAAAVLEVGDLDALATPEAIMLSSMSDEFAKDRTDREMVVPWLKFLWEIYRAILELLYKNGKLEKTYHRCAEKAFKFCIDYKRNLEFRRLCEMLRSHLIFIQKGVGQVRNGIKQEWLPESREMHLVTRFKQLEAATSLELWNEGFRAVEDIYAINQLVKKSTKAFMISYYQKLTEIFWVSDSPLFHAYAWFKFYSLSRDGNRELSAERRTAFATATLVATLSLPPTAKSAVEYSGDEDEKNARMATLLDFHANPSRESLMAELERQGITAHVAPEFQGLFQLMEKKFAPLTFVQNVMPYVKKLQASESLSKYASVFLQGCIVKLVAQLSTVYSSVKMDFVRKLVAPAGLNFCEVESFLMRAVYKKQLQMRVDHVNGYVYFGTLQAATSAMETQVARFGAAMQRISAKINSQSPSVAQAASQQRAAYLKRVAAAADDVHARALERKSVIERRKEDLEERKQVRIELETVRRQEEEKVRQANEMKRIVEEEANREKERRSNSCDIKSRFISHGNFPLGNYS